MSTTDTFTFTGSVETWTVPADVQRINARVWGGGGGQGRNSDGTGGDGGYANVLVSVSPGEELEVRVGERGGDPFFDDGWRAGEGGWPRGGDGNEGGIDGSASAGGGGRSEVRPSGASISDAFLVAGAGAGNGGSSGRDGGDGGGTSGGDAAFTRGGDGATQSGPGAGGEDGDCQDGVDGSSVQGSGGGNGGGGFGDCNGGGGGGDGWWGGGGGAANESFGGNGGGGSGWTTSSAISSTMSTGVNTGHGEVEIEWREAPVAPSNVSATIDSETNAIELEWVADSDDHDTVEIYRDTTEGVDTSGSAHSVVSSTTKTFTDGDVDEGATYYYRLVAVDDTWGSSDDSTEVSATTDGPAPSDVVLTGVDSDTWDATWTLNSEGEEEVRVEMEQAESGTWETDATYGPGTEAHTKADALDGQWYRVRVVAVFPDTESESEPSESIVTDLPGVTNLEAQDPEA